MDMKKSQLLALLGNDELEPVIRGLLELADRYARPELRSEALIQSGRLEEYKKHLRAGVADYETLARHRAAVRQALLDVVQALPEQMPAPRPGGRLPGMSESAFKRLLFWCVLLGQGVVLLWLWFQSDTGGFARKELTATLTLLLAVFAAYLMPMYQELVKNRYLDLLDAPPPEKRLRWMLPLLTFVVILPTYFGLLFYFIHLRGRGDWGFDDFTTALTLLATGLGAYLSVLIQTVFKQG